MSVYESGSDGHPSSINDLAIRARQILDIIITPYGEKKPVFDSERLSYGLTGIHRIDAAIDEDLIGTGVTTPG